MKKRANRYILEHRKLGIGTHLLNFEIKKDFFDIFDYSEYHNGNIKVEMELEIGHSNIIGHINFSGYVVVQCDICLETFNQAVESNFDIVFKFVEEMPEIDTTDELVYISNKSDKINLTNIFYDYIVLSLPMKKVHPLDSEGNRTCNPEILKKLEEYESSIKIKDPRWDELKKIFN